MVLKLFFYTKNFLSFNFLRFYKAYRKCVTFFALINMCRLLCLRHTERHIGIHIRCWLFYPVLRRGGITK